MRQHLALGLGLLLGACGSGRGADDSGDDGTTNDAPTADGSPFLPDADPNAPDAGPNDWVPLITANWTLPPNSEMYICATKTMTQDVYSHAMRPIAPLGTHHTVIDLQPPEGPDNPGFPCGPEFGAFWASGYGTQPLTLPDGVALLAPQGQQLKLSLHLFNASDQPLSGTSGLESQRMNAADVVHTASVDYHGPFTFAIPGNNQPYTTTHTTSIGNRTLVAIFPHMHQLGIHFQARIVGGPTLWDDDYQFESQEFAPLASIPVTSGQTLETQCTWRNNTGSTVYWGDSSTAEMCFTILMSY